MTKFGSRLHWAVLPAMAFATHCNSTSAAPVDGGASDAPAADTSMTPVGDGAAPVGDGAVRVGDGAAGDGAAVGCTFGAGVDGGPQAYAANDPNIQYFGRIDLTSVAPSPAFSESATYVTANFLGSSVSITLDEHNGGVLNYFETIIDDYPPVPLLNGAPYPSFQHIFAVAPAYDDAGAPVPLPCGPHKITIAKRTEADYGRADFEGFSFAQILPPDPPAAHKVEIIGDSITCGAGVEATSANAPECSQNFGEGVENGYFSYGPVLARSLGADWHVTCASGIGLVRNYYSRGDQRTMPQIYPYLDPEAMNPMDLTLWPTTQWAASAGTPIDGTPDAIVIGLGTNDFSRDSPPAADGGIVYRDPIALGSLDAGGDAGAGTLEGGYVMFIDQLKTYYPHVSVFLVTSPILGDMYPTPTDMQLTQHAQAVSEVAAYYATDPDVKVYPVVIPKVIGTGCGGHPNVAQQASAADAIATTMKTALGW